MPTPVYPNSPPPANYDRSPQWSVEANRYFSGKAQFSTSYVRPLYDYTLSYENAPEARRKELEDFWNDRNGERLPFLFTDPKTEHHYANSVALGYFVSSRMGRFYTTNSWRVLACSGYFNIFSALSGQLTNGVHYAYSQDNGFFTVFTAHINSTDTFRWTGTYARLCHFDKDFNPKSRLWGNYAFNVDFYEVLP